MVDTYGGDFTYRDVEYEIIDGETVFYETYYGAKPVPMTEITDEEELAELRQAVKENLGLKP
jgi:hypothetical protein